MISSKNRPPISQERHTDRKTQQQPTEQETCAVRENFQGASASKPTQVRSWDNTPEKIRSKFYILLEEPLHTDRKTQQQPAGQETCDVRENFQGASASKPTQVRSWDNTSEKIRSKFYIPLDAPLEQEPQDINKNNDLVQKLGHASAAMKTQANQVSVPSDPVNGEYVPGASASQQDQLPSCSNQSEEPIYDAPWNSELDFNQLSVNLAQAAGESPEVAEPLLNTREEEQLAKKAENQETQIRPARQKRDFESVKRLCERLLGKMS